MNQVRLVSSSEAKESNGYGFPFFHVVGRCYLIQVIFSFIFLFTCPRMRKVLKYKQSSKNDIRAPGLCRFFNRK